MDYRAIAIEAHGDLPQPCYFCREQCVELGANDTHVHHVDHDRTNNEPSNLVFAHMSCHRSYHSTLNASATFGARWARPGAQLRHAENMRRIMADPGRRKAQSDILRSVVAVTNRKTTPCEYCGREMNAGNLAQHKRARHRDVH